MENPSNTETAAGQVNPVAPDNNTQPKRKGRKPAPLVWPSGQFTIVQLAQANGMSKQNAVVRSTKAIKCGEIVRLTDTLKTGKIGKPSFLYQVA